MCACVCVSIHVPVIFCVHVCLRSTFTFILLNRQGTSLWNSRCFYLQSGLEFDENLLEYVDSDFANFKKVKKYRSPCDETIGNM